MKKISESKKVLSKLRRTVLVNETDEKYTIYVGKESDGPVFDYSQDGDAITFLKNMKNTGHGNDFCALDDNTTGARWRTGSVNSILDFLQGNVR